MVQRILKCSIYALKGKTVPGNYFYSLLLFIIISCKSEEKNRPLFTLVKDSGIEFQNTVTDTKSDNSFYFRNFYNGGGVALGDINNDGLSDVVLTSNMGENKIYLNKGDFKFDDITPASGFRQDSMWSTGVVMADINADGWLDIYICNSGHMKDGNRRNKLYINNKNSSFTERSKEYGLDISGYCTQASFFDYDMDGDLDCFLINNSPIPFSSLNYADMRDADISKWNVDENLKGGGNHLYNNSQGKYTEVTREAGLHSGLISFGLGVSVGDINGDHYPDIYVGNDFIEKDYLYINQKNGTFKDQLEEQVQKISMSSMSSDLGDINNDGHPEIFTTDMIPEDDYRLKTTGTFDNIDLYLSKQKAGLYHQYVRNCLQLNNGDGSFSEIANFCGVSSTDWSWGALFLDADNDGLNDIFICNGITKDLGDLDFLDFFSNDVYRNMLETGRRQEIDEILKHIPVNPIPNRVFKNNGNLQFTDIGNSWGFDQPGFSNSIAYADLDNDGDLDLLINNENQPASVYKNHTNEVAGNNYFSVMLKGKGFNSFAIGSQVRIYKGKEIFYREVSPARGFQASVDYKQIIGLGKITEVDSVVIIWPDRTYTKINDPQLNKLHLINEPENKTEWMSFENISTWFRVTDSLDKHVEDDYVDFYYERNLPVALSREGPKIATADVNGDGMEDFYIGGAKDQPGQLYIQTSTGFIRSVQEVFKTYASFEDVAVSFFDADKDSDHDLFLGAGGNNAAPGSREIQHRLYVNDGKGNFNIDTKAFPNNDMNISVAAPNDIDGDGDIDLFVGSSSVPNHYGLRPQSYMYLNDGKGHFVDATSTFNPELSTIGMIKAALWTDINGDGKKELIVTGEWMPTRIFDYKDKKLNEIKSTGLEQLHGWWQSLYAADLNSDGKTDLVIGNIGENFYLKPDQKNPANIWINDFDGSGTKEQFLTRTIGGKDMPVFLKREVTDQFPALKKQNLKHSDYANKSVEDLFGKELARQSEVRSFNYCTSIIAINNGNGKFSIQPLPARVQISSVNAIAASDIDKDGKPDLLLGGNMFGFPPQFGRLDASYGHVLLNKGNGKFEWISPEKSGIKLRGEIKDIRTVNTKGGQKLLITQNNETPLLYEWIKK